MIINLDELTAGSEARLKRIMKLKNCDEQAAIEFALSAGWLAAERLAMKKHEIREQARKAFKDRPHDPFRGNYY